MSEEFDDPWADAPTRNSRQVEDVYELNDESDVETLMRQPMKAASAIDSATIDWLQEDAFERSRQQRLHSIHGVQGLLAQLFDTWRIWFITVMTGVGVGVIGAWLDVLVRWLSDLREGRCEYGIFYNQVACCSGLDPGEDCTQWFSWSKWFGIEAIFVQSLLQASIYNILAIIFSSSAAVLVVVYAPFAFHTGIPEIKAILSGYVFDEFLGPWILLIKSLGLALAVSSGLSLGKEGPLVHVSCCMALFIARLFRNHRPNETQKRRILAAAAAAGISVAFGSPLGGVLFGLEELEHFANDSDIIWRAFVTSVIAAVSLQYIDPFGTSKLVLFQVTNGDETWRAFELVPWFFLSVIGGVLGSLLIKLNVAAAVYRHRSILRDYPVLEVIGATAITGCISYLVVFLRVQTSELVANLFLECDPAKGDYHGLCNPTASVENVFLLILTALVKIGLTAWTFGMMIPAGIFLPTIAIGACIGRAVGLMVQGLHRSYPALWIFSACPPDPSVRCVSPGFYAVIGASAMLGGVTRMTISLVVIMFELTGALSHVLPIMISVMVAKWVGDAFGKEGIYPSWIALRNYPWIPSNEYRDGGETASSILVPFKNLVTLEAEGLTIPQLKQLLKSHDYHGYPVVTREKELIGYVTRASIKTIICQCNPLSIIFCFPLNASVPAAYSSQDSERVYGFVRRNEGPSNNSTNLDQYLEEAAIQLKREVPLELVVNTFQKMNIRYIFFTRHGRLEGLVTKTDIVRLLRSHIPNAGDLEREKSMYQSR
ncbi:Cl-channel protein [Schizopora paradoxa]|uniref:Chloride channel protein n=1 Tax=Schizopora paradoxa TaxID=27342 RepID=A0A0H2SPS5_9AGAM|nr:Cl-channel protein [Schizopora paradoxa]